MLEIISVCPECNNENPMDYEEMKNVISDIKKGLFQTVSKQDIVEARKLGIVTCENCHCDYSVGDSKNWKEIKDILENADDE